MDDRTKVELRGELTRANDEIMRLAALLEAAGKQYINRNADCLRAEAERDALSTLAIEAADELERISLPEDNVDKLVVRLRAYETN